MDKFVVTVKGRFVREDGGYTEEYPDAAVHERMAHAISIAKMLDKYPNMGTIEVIKDYGYDSESVVWSNKE